MSHLKWNLLNLTGVQIILLWSRICSWFLWKGEWWWPPPSKNQPAGRTGPRPGDVVHLPQLPGRHLQVFPQVSICQCYLKITWSIRNPLDYVGPEVEALLRLVIWHATHWAKGTSVRTWFSVQRHSDWRFETINMLGAIILLFFAGTVERKSQQKLLVPPHLRAHLILAYSNGTTLFVGWTRGFGDFLPLPLPSSDGWACTHTGSPKNYSGVFKSSTFCKSTRYPDIHPKAQQFNFKKVHLCQIGLRYLDQRQTLVSAAFAAIPAAPDLTLFFRFVQKSKNRYCWFPGLRHLNDIKVGGSCSQLCPAGQLLALSMQWPPLLGGASPHNILVIVSWHLKKKMRLIDTPVIQFVPG